MAVLSTDVFFRTSLFIYLLSAAVSLVLIKRQKICIIVSNALCIAAALLGGAASVLQIFSAGGISIRLFQSNIPLLDFAINFDALSAYFVLALSILVLSVSLYSIGYMRNYIGKRSLGLFGFLYSAFILSMVLVLTASNTVFFYIAWEAMSVLSFFLVVFNAEKKADQKAGTLYVIMTHIAAAFLLIGFMIAYSYTKSFDISGSAEAIPAFAKNIIFLMLVIGFGTKAGVIPLHIWLPQAYPTAPSNVSALMSGIMAKTAIYGFIRFLLCYLGVQNTWWGILILVLGILSAVLGVAYAFVENNLKRLVAFSSIENIGIVLIGLGVCLIAAAHNKPFLGGLALTASLLHTLNHTLFKGGLFMGTGSIIYATRTKELDKLGGLIKKMPVTALLVLCFSLAISAIIPFNGFISEWLTYQALIANISPGQAGMNILSIISVAALGMTGALAAACFVKFFGISFLGRPRSEHSTDVKKVPSMMTAGMAVLALLCLFIGLFPILVVRLLDRVVSGITGVSIAGQLQGGFLQAFSSIQTSNSAIAPLAAAAAVIVIIGLTLFGLRLYGKKFSVRKYGTWDCGFQGLTPRMQYTAEGYANPIKIVFRILFRPTRKITTTGHDPYHPETTEYSAKSYSFIENKLYRPVYEKVTLFSKRIKFTIQTGSVHSYLFYIFIFVLILMAYNKLV